jgi:excisionase family DNA binding protein
MIQGPVATDMLKKAVAAALCGVSVRTLERYVASGILPVVRYTKRNVRFRRKDIENFIQQHWVGKGAKA